MLAAPVFPVVPVCCRDVPFALVLEDGNSGVADVSECGPRYVEEANTGISGRCGCSTIAPELVDGLPTIAGAYAAVPPASTTP